MVIMDASAALAWLRQEPGSERVRDLLAEALIPATNWSEVLQKTRARGEEPMTVASLLSGLGLAVADVTEEDGRIAAELWQAGAGQSLADRICLASGIRHGLPVVTADRGWAGIAQAPELILIR